MKKLLVQNFLLNNSFKDLQEKHGVYASFSKSGHKWSLNYDQLEAKENDPLAQECRGLILSRKDGKPMLPSAWLSEKPSYDHICPGETKILSFPMKRFFNYGQGVAYNINWNDKGLSILEKLDGTLCTVYYDFIINQWCVSTRSVPDADLPMDNNFTFRTLFEKALKDTSGLDFCKFTEKLCKNTSYCFELTTPYNRIVVKYNNFKITLLAARDLISLNELDINLLNEVKSIPCVKTFNYSSIDELLNWVNSLNPLEMEGVVVRDSYFNRIKIKNPEYVVFNKCRDSFASERNCMESILFEKDDDVLQFMPDEIAKNLISLKIGLNKAIQEHDRFYSIAKSNNFLSKKEFATFVLNNKDIWSAPIFQMYDGKAQNMPDFIIKSKKEGTWSNTILDKFIELSKKYNQ